MTRSISATKNSAIIVDRVVEGQPTKIDSGSAVTILCGYHDFRKVNDLTKKDAQTRDATSDGTWSTFFGYLDDIIFSTTVE